MTYGNRSNFDGPNDMEEYSDLDSMVGLFAGAAVQTTLQQGRYKLVCLSGTPADTASISKNLNNAVLSPNTEVGAFQGVLASPFAPRRFVVRETCNVVVSTTGTAQAYIQRIGR